jgi:hypothetical protein
MRSSEGVRTLVSQNRPEVQPEVQLAGTTSEALPAPVDLRRKPQETRRLKSHRKLFQPQLPEAPPAAPPLGGCGELGFRVERP